VHLKHLSWARRLVRDESGVSAVEFALILPIMVLLYLGLAEITLAMMAERRASHAASAVGDLLAQSPQNIKNAGVNQVLYIGDASLQPFPTADLSLRVTSVQADTNGTPKVVWSKAKGPALSKLANGATVAGFPTNLLAAGESLIMSEVKYSYNTPLYKVIPRTLNFQDVFYLRPRRADVISCADCT
jgi:Flp pilus assembly protein TadG